MRTAPRAQQTSINHSSATTRPELTLLDHLQEIRARLFLTVIALIVAAAASYTVQDQIMAALMHPLGGQQLVYLTPIGGFNFLFKVSLFVGFALILPVIIFHIYRFLEPLMPLQRKRSVVFYILASFVLAIGGGCFAYFGGLPAALHFLTNFDIQNVSAMLTVDSYLSFVITYVLGFAALFQIPLVLMIINTIRPIPPKKLMGFQRYVILVAFVLAAIISPTPDITNQTLLAIPILVMYQVGILTVWLQTRSYRKKQHTPHQLTVPQPALRRSEQTQFTAAPVRQTVQARSTNTLAAPQPQPVVRPRQRPRPVVMDIAASPAMPAQHRTRRAAMRPTVPARSTARPTLPITRNNMIRPTSIDGFSAPPRRAAQANIN